MCLCFRNQLTIPAAAAAAVLLWGCASTIKTAHLGSVHGQPQETAARTTGAQLPESSRIASNGGLPVANKYGERYDGDVEQVIAQRSLKAWRIATAHDKQGGQDSSSWQKQRAADEKESMAQLNQLSQSYPTVSTIQLMMGQVEEHFGHHEQAIGHYKIASKKNLISGMTLFKLAEAERKAGKTKDAIKDYQKLIEAEPDFIPGQVGLAQTLLQQNLADTQALNLLHKVLEREPDNEEARQLLTRAGKPEAKTD